MAVIRLIYGLCSTWHFRLFPDMNPLERMEAHRLTKTIVRRPRYCVPRFAGLYHWFYVYELVDPRDGAVFYVGKGTGIRVHQHFMPSKLRGNSRKAQRIKEIQALGLEVGRRIVGLFENGQDACSHEAALIKQYGYATLTNCDPEEVIRNRPVSGKSRISGKIPL